MVPEKHVTIFSKCGFLSEMVKKQFNHVRKLGGEYAFKGTVSVIESDPPYKDVHTGSITSPLNALSDQV